MAFHHVDERAKHRQGVRHHPRGKGPAMAARKVQGPDQGIGQLDLCHLAVAQVVIH
ncbi:hypothetical protein D3C78_1620400 [compost metagenome]